MFFFFLLFHDILRRDGMFLSHMKMDHRKRIQFSVPGFTLEEQNYSVITDFLPHLTFLGIKSLWNGMPALVE